MRIIFAPKALRQLAQLEKNTQRRIVQKLSFFASQKDPLLFAGRITHTQFGEWRFRIGEYRILFDIDRRERIIILCIGHRKNIYR